MLALALTVGAAKPFVLDDNTRVDISINHDASVVNSAREMLAGDVLAVLNDTLVVSAAEGPIIAGVGLTEYYDKADKAFFDENGRESFIIKVLDDGRLLIAGADSHGLAYGMLELSRLMGVSPWEWWADATPRRLDRFELPAGYTNRQAPDVDYRGIFINDEDWGLMPWSSTTMEPGNKRGVVGPLTNEKIFQLLLRLRANYYWPAMHEVTEPFFLTPGNREMAEKYGIYIAAHIASLWRRARP